MSESAVLERALDRIQTDPGTGCWVWQGAPDAKGYGRIKTSLGTLAHRVVYQLLVGPIPPDLTLDHLCRNRICVNPIHLEPVTRLENLRRGIWPTKTHCPQGHPYEVHGRLNSAGYQECAECRRIRARQKYEADQEAQRARNRAYYWTDPDRHRARRNRNRRKAAA